MKNDSQQFISRYLHYYHVAIYQRRITFCFCTVVCVIAMISIDDISSISTVDGKSFIDREQAFWTKLESTIMTEEFIRKGLTTSVAQICSNIGWHSMSNSTLQMMTDILYEYFRDLAQSVKKFSEICEYLFVYTVRSVTLNMEYII
jgi:hypothetical protein